MRRLEKLQKDQYHNEDHYMEKLREAEADMKEIHPFHYLCCGWNPARQLT